MDAQSKRRLKRLGKAEVERRSSELRAALEAANPAPVGSDLWAEQYRTGVQREVWVQKKLPILHKDRLDSLFVVHANEDAGWEPHLGGYVLCAACGSAVPSAIPKRLFYWASCACGNIRWRCLLGWGRTVVLDASSVIPVKLTGRG